MFSMLRREKREKFSQKKKNISLCNAKRKWSWLLTLSLSKSQRVIMNYTLLFFLRFAMFNLRHEMKYLNSSSSHFRFFKHRLRPSWLVTRRRRVKETLVTKSQRNFLWLQQKRRSSAIGVNEQRTIITLEISYTHKRRSKCMAYQHLIDCWERRIRKVSWLKQLKIHGASSRSRPYKKSCRDHEYEEESIIIVWNYSSTTELKCFNLFFLSPILSPFSITLEDQPQQNGIDIDEQFGYF